MRKTCLALGLTFLLAGCGAAPMTAADRASGGFAAAAKLGGGKAGGTGGGKRDAGKLVSKKPVSPVPTNAGLMFRLLDANADGAVTPAEWPYDAASIERGATPHATADKNHDGRIGEDEWMAFATARFQDAPFVAVDIAEGFLRVDLDASEKLTADEVGLFIGWLEAPVRASLYLDGEPISAWVKAGDLNRDFALDRAELERLLAQLMVRRFGDVG